MLWVPITPGRPSGASLGPRGADWDGPAAVSARHTETERRGRENPRSSVAVIHADPTGSSIKPSFCPDNVN